MAHLPVEKDMPIGLRFMKDEIEKYDDELVLHVAISYVLAVLLS